MVLRVPPRAGECRFVRVTSVLIFARAPGLCCFCVGARARTAREICPAAGSRQRPPQCARRNGHCGLPPGTRRSRPDGGSLPQRGAPAPPSAPGHANAFEAPPCAPGAAPHHHSSPARRPSANKTTHSNEKRPAERGTARRSAGRTAGRSPHRGWRGGPAQQARAAADAGEAGQPARVERGDRGAGLAVEYQRAAPRQRGPRTAARHRVRPGGLTIYQRIGAPGHAADPGNLRQHGITTARPPSGGQMSSTTGPE